MTIDSTNNPRPGSRAIAPHQDPERAVMPPANPSSPQASPVSLAALYKQLPDIFAKSFQTMRSATTEGEKRKI